MFSQWPSYSSDEIKTVVDVLSSGKVNYWTGDIARLFEKEFAAWCGSKYAVAVMNGTVALELALKAVGVSDGDEVIVTPRSFMASVSSVVTVGASPIFVDVERDSGNIDLEKILPLITARTKALICVHLAGWPCDMDPIMALAERHGLFVIEDCAQAHGARYKGRSVGSIGHIGAWSFCQDKIMSTGGEGGMVTCNDEALWRAMWSYKDHGKSYAAVYERDQPPGFRWLHESFGTNWRMTEMQAAIGIIQLKRMRGWTAARTVNAMAIREAMLPFLGEGGVIRAPIPDRFMKHAHYKFYAYIRAENLADGWSRDRVVDEINSRGVPCYTGSCSEIYLEKAFDNTGFRPAERLLVAKELGETSLMFLVHPTLTEAEIRKMQDVVAEVLTMASLP